MSARTTAGSGKRDGPHPFRCAQYPTRQWHPERQPSSLYQRPQLRQATRARILMTRTEWPWAASTPAQRIRTKTRSKMSPYGSAVDMIQLCVIKSIRGVTELARDFDISVDLQVGDLIARQGRQHRRHPVARAAATGVQVRRSPDAHAVLVEQAEQQVVGWQV